MGFVYFPHGAVHEVLGRRSETGTDFTMSPILKPLEPFRSQLTIVSGLRNKGGESSDPHGIMAGTWLSCYGIKNRKDDLGTTADQLAARKFGANTPLPSLELAGEGGAATCDQSGDGCGYRQHTWRSARPSSRCRWNTTRARCSTSCSARATTQQEREAILSETDSLLDYVMDEGSRAEQAHRRRRPRARSPITWTRCARSKRACRSWPPARAWPMDLPERAAGRAGRVRRGASETLFDLIALAWQANQTRVASMMMAKEVSMRTYPNLQHHRGLPSAVAPRRTIRPRSSGW